MAGDKPIPSADDDPHAGQSNYHPSRSQPGQGPHKVNWGATPALPASSMGSPLVPSREKQPDTFSVTDAVRRIDRDSFATFARQPCVRESLMTAIGTGFAVFGALLVVGRPVTMATNWFVGSGLGMATVAYPFCQYRRYKEVAGVQVIVDTLDKKAMRAREMREAQEARQREAEEERRRWEEEQRRRRWWKFW